MRVARPVYRFTSRGRRGRGWRGRRERRWRLDTAAVPRGCLGRTLGPTRRADLYLQAGGDGNILGQLDPASQTLELGRGSLVEVDPGRAIVLRGPGQNHLDGILNAWGGRIDVRNSSSARSTLPRTIPAQGARPAPCSLHLDWRAGIAGCCRPRCHCLGWARSPLWRSAVRRQHRHRRRDRSGKAIATSADAFVIVRPGARLEGLRQPGTAGSYRDTGRVLLAGDGGAHRSGVPTMGCI